MVVIVSTGFARYMSHNTSLWSCAHTWCMGHWNTPPETSATLHMNPAGVKPQPLRAQTSPTSFVAEAESWMPPVRSARRVRATRGARSQERWRPWRFEPKAEIGIKGVGLKIGDTWDTTILPLSAIVNRVMSKILDVTSNGIVMSMNANRCGIPRGANPPALPKMH